MRGRVPVLVFVLGAAGCALPPPAHPAASAPPGELDVASTPMRARACGSLVGEWVVDEPPGAMAISVRFVFAADGSFASERSSFGQPGGACTYMARTDGVTWRASNTGDHGEVTLYSGTTGRETHGSRGRCADAGEPTLVQRTSDETMQFTIEGSAEGDTLRLVRATGPMPLSFRRVKTRVACR